MDDGQICWILQLSNVHSNIITVVHHVWLTNLSVFHHPNFESTHFAQRFKFLCFHVVAVVAMSGFAEVKLFGRWAYDDVNVSDLSLSDYKAVTGKATQSFLPHTQGRYQQKRFRKALCPIVGQMACSS